MATRTIAQQECPVTRVAVAASRLVYEAARSDADWARRAAEIAELGERGTDSDARALRSTSEAVRAIYELQMHVVRLRDVLDRRLNAVDEDQR